MAALSAMACWVARPVRFGLRDSLLGVGEPGAFGVLHRQGQLPGWAKMPAASAAMTANASTPTR